MDGTLGDERAPLQDGQKCNYGPYYRRSTSLQSLNVTSSSTLTSILVKKVRIRQAKLHYRRNDENRSVDVSKDYENYFNATILEKVNTERHGEERYPVDDEFYPALHRLLTARRTWGLTFEFRGCSTFMVGVMEWTKRVLVRCEEPLKRAVYPNLSITLMQMYGGLFVNFGGPLTNTLHHGAGEVGISLYDLERIGGLPILGAIYEEFLLPNKDLAGHNKYPTTVVELLWIHAELCEFHKVKNIYYDLWLNHFYGEYLVYFAYGEQTNSEKEKVETNKRRPLHVSRQERETDSNVTAEGELAAFLALWLSRFVLPHGKEVIRPKTFVMAALMASGQRISLSPMVFGCIYHSLGEAASDPDHPGKANISFPSYYVIGWLAELFPCLYHRCPDSDYLGYFPTLLRYAGLLSNKLSLPQAKHIFKDGRYLSLRGSSYREDSCNG
ncbi:hypothetical protein Cgig2_020320 [Carnegiea gigantea]|uniref:Aminotransferase-like plant mobile domain-containing protein n=1 Tax=Carnegiea gigantea TaxID=171969 RepID=A0A9Q1JUC5_9CARY|nr:hypothetical protein Cgig2_020320 [Carnegiea gigantea]